MPLRIRNTGPSKYLGGHCVCTLIATFLVASCGIQQDGSAADVQTSGETLRLVGKIDVAMARSVTSAINGGSIKAIHIHSPGGESAAALEIAKLIQEHEMDIVIEGACISACAQYLFVAARQRFLAPGSLVGFHNSVKSTHALAARLGDRAPKGFAEARYELVPAEEDLYRHRGVDESLLMNPEIFMQPICVGFRYSATGKLQWTVLRNYEMWVPTRSQLEATGVTVEGYWPSTRDEVIKAARKFYAEEHVQRIRFGDEDHGKHPVFEQQGFDGIALCKIEEA